MKVLNTRTALYLVFLTGAAKVNRITNSAVEATIQGFKVIGDKTILSLDRKQDKACSIYVKGVNKILDNANKEKVSLQQRLDTVDNRADEKLSALARVTSL